MATIIIPTFKGEQPREHKRLISEGQAQVAVNCKFERGAIEARKGMSAATLASMSDRSFFRHEDIGWLKRSVHVDWTRSAVANNVGHVFITGDGYPKQVASSVSERRLGLPRPTVPATIAVNGTATSQNVERSSSYVYTLVADLGVNGEQESAPSPPTGIVDVKPGQSVALSGMSVPSLAGITVTKFRFYRTVSGNTTAGFYYLGEIPVATATFNDAIADKDMSTESLQTNSWDIPPDTAKGMIYADNGIYAMFSGNTLLLSEPFVPYAYPEAYRLNMADDIVALGQFDGNIVVTTNGRPYLVVGSAPESMQLIHLPFEQSCVAKRSLVSIPSGVLYASPDGLCLITASAQNVVTRNIYTKEQWQALSPSGMASVYHEDKYISFFVGTGKGLVLDFTASDVTEIDLGASVKVWDLWVDAASDALYLLVEESGAMNIRRWEGASTPLTYRWRSKEFFMSVAVLPAVVRVEGEHDATSPATLRLYSGGTLRQSISISDTTPKRLAVGRSEKAWEIEVEGTRLLSEIRVSTSIEELENGV